jgi:hypothetical protein
MRKTYTGLKRLCSRTKQLNLTFFILFVFAIDCFIGEFDVMVTPPYHDTPEMVNIETKADLLLWYDNQTEWANGKHAGDIAKSFYSWMPYIFILLFISYKKSLLELRPDFIDKAMAGICLFSCMITTFDYIVNFNLRPVWMDWTVLGGALMFLFVVKLIKLSK